MIAEDAPAWTATEVKMRFLEAMRTIQRLPEQGRMRQIRAIWPDDTFARDPGAIYAEEWQRDRVIISELGEDEFRERRRLDRRRRPMPPSPIEIDRMNRAMIWPARYLDETDRRIINVWAHEVTTTGRSSNLARELGISKQWLNRRILRISGIVAAGLRRDRIPLL